jgi:hypothetical protein
MAYGTYQTRNPLARTNPLRSIPFLQAAQPQLTPGYLAAWELDRASVVMPLRSVALAA